MTWERASSVVECEWVGTCDTLFRIDCAVDKSPSALCGVYTVCGFTLSWIHNLLCMFVRTYAHCTYVHMYGTFHKKLDDERRSVCVRTVTVRALTAVRTAYVRVLFVPTRFLSL